MNARLTIKPEHLATMKAIQVCEDMIKELRLRISELAATLPKSPPMETSPGPVTDSAGNRWQIKARKI